MAKGLKKSVLVCIAAMAVTSPAHAWLSASRTWISFPRTEINRGSASDWIQIYNFGTAAARGLSLTHGCFSGFNLTHFCFGDLQPGSSCSITLAFRPNRVGMHSCSVMVSSFDQGMVSINVSGEGI